MRPSKPAVSVVMPVYNAGEHLVDAVSSIIEQSYCNWELICVDDGSTDMSSRLLDWFAVQDDRIRVVHQENRGIVGALNRGCELARAPLICRMDSDDIAFANRIERQLAAMESLRDVSAIGGAILEIDADGDPLCSSRLPSTHELIERNLLHRKTGLFHPTVMMRADVFRSVGTYRSEYQWVEDHDLWLRMAMHGRLANLNATVLCYRQHASSICWQRGQQQRQLMNRLLGEAYRDRGMEVLESMISNDTVSRSNAGPGKWARAAARGGYPKSLAKHWQRMMKNPTTRLGYATRMTLESLLRLSFSLPRRILNPESIAVPRFQHWHLRCKAFLATTSFGATGKNAAA